MTLGLQIEEILRSLLAFGLSLTIHMFPLIFVSRWVGPRSAGHWTFLLAQWQYSLIYIYVLPSQSLKICISFLTSYLATN